MRKPKAEYYAEGNIGSGDDSGVNSSPDIGGLMNDFSNQMNQALQNQKEQSALEMEHIKNNLLGALESQNDYMNKYQDEQNKQFQEYQKNQSSEFNSLFGDMESYYDRQLKNLRNQIDGFATTYNKSSNIQYGGSGGRDYGGGSGGSNSGIYFDGQDDDVQYNRATQNAKDLVSRGELSKKNADDLLKQIAGQGNSGVGWSATGKAEQDRKDRLNDSSVRQSEIDRAKNVIENRKDSGQNTKVQEDYLNRLLKGGS